MTDDNGLMDTFVKYLNDKFSVDDVAKAVLTDGFHPDYFIVGNSSYSGKHLQAMARLWLMRDEIITEMNDAGASAHGCSQAFYDLLDKVTAIAEEK